MGAFTQHSSEEFIHVFTHTPVHTERSVAQAYNQRFRRLNLGMNSHQRRMRGFHEILIPSDEDLRELADRQTAA